MIGCMCTACMGLLLKDFAVHACAATFHSIARQCNMLTLRKRVGCHGAVSSVQAIGAVNNKKCPVLIAQFANSDAAPLFCKLRQASVNMPPCWQV